jgi:hypothetical protein
LLDLALGLAVGGDCLADVAVLRAEPGVFELVASDPTMPRTIDPRVSQCLLIKSRRRRTMW